MAFLFAAPDASSLLLCRAEAFAALGQHQRALEDLDAVCKAEPGEHEVSRGDGPSAGCAWSQISLYGSSFPLS